MNTDELFPTDTNTTPQPVLRVEHPPFQPSSPTSWAAAEAIKPVAAKCRRRVLKGFASFGKEGATRQEVADFIRMSGDTLRPRVLELAGIGAIVNTGRTRFTPSRRQAEILRITEAGALMLAQSGATDE